MDWKAHAYRVGASLEMFDDIPSDAAELDKFIANHRRKIEPWLSAVFQAEHLNLLLGSGFTTAVAFAAGVGATGMDIQAGTSRHAEAILQSATASAQAMGRGAPNIEDQLRSAISVLEGLSIVAPEEANEVRSDINAAMERFLYSLLGTERGIAETNSAPASALLQSFLLSFASRAASRERLHVFTTNYDRLVERGCDAAGLRIIDRFVGTLRPLFRNSRIELDYHYNPPGIRGEPRFMEGVVRFTKIHGSLDWRFDPEMRRIFRTEMPFGADEDHPSLPASPVDTVMIYPNPAKDVETTHYPYAEFFRDFASASCRPNAVVVTYGYGFGDDHIPNEAGATVAYVTWIGIERSPYPKRAGLKDFGLVDLPFPLRKMALSPIGTLTVRRGRGASESTYELSRGVVAFPSVGDQILIPTPEQIAAIVGAKDADRRVKIGTSPRSGSGSRS